ncbi:MAG: hypothetical protein KatS3mg110_3431 [Pirellulaceae bacterium]|nr:MAG: hypothetical protein KatS3mg110_3431 [Pirellulaceae bacterium]
MARPSRPCGPPTMLGNAGVERVVRSPDFPVMDNLLPMHESSLANPLLGADSQPPALVGHLLDKPLCVGRVTSSGA